MPFGGLGTGSSTTSVNSPYAGALASMGEQQWKLAKPLLSQLGAQFQQALQTGGVNSFIPWINSAMDAVRQSGSTGIEQLRQRLALTGQGSSSVGNAQLNEANATAGNTANMTPGQMIMQFIQQAPGFAENLASRGQSALSSAASFNNTTTQATTPSFWDQFQSAFLTFAPQPFTGSSATAPSGAAPAPASGAAAGGAADYGAASNAGFGLDSASMVGAGSFGDAALAA